MAREGWVVWAAAIVVGAVLPVGALFDLEESDAWSLVSSLVHSGEFAVFAVLVAVAWRDRVPSSTGLIPSIVLSLLLAVLIELLQAPIPWRDFSWLDLAFDVAGIAVGCLVLIAVRGARGARPWARG